MNECTLVVVGTCSYIRAGSCRAAVTIDNLILVVKLSKVLQVWCVVWCAHCAYEYHL